MSVTPIHPSTRLANKNVWEESTGYNSLLHKVHLSSKAPISGVSMRNDAMVDPEKFRVKSHNGSLEFVLPGTLSAPISLEVFSLAGESVWSLTLNSAEGGRCIVKWPAYSPGIYLWRSSLNDKKPAFIASGVVRSLAVDDR